MKRRYYTIIMPSHVYFSTEFNGHMTNIMNYDGSVNFYMFHGGTNFGFMNGMIMR